MLFFKNKNISENKLLHVFIGALYPLGFAPINIWILTAISVSLLIYLVCELYESNSSRNIDDSKIGLRNSIISLCFYWNLGAYGVGVSWVYVSIHEFGNAVLPLAILITGLFVLVLSVAKVIFGYLIYKLVSYCGKSMLLLIFPFAWVISEALVSTAFNGFPWLLLGYSQIDGPLSSIATWFGVYGVGWFNVIILAALVFIIRDAFKLKESNQSIDPDIQQRLTSQLKRNTVIILVVASFPFLNLFFESEVLNYKDKESLDVALVQPKISQEKKWKREYFSEIIDTLYSQSEQHWDADLIVWPEGAIPAYQHQVKDIMADLQRKLKPSRSNLLAGLPVYDKEKKVSYVGFSSIGDTSLNPPQTYYKQILVPFGEYVPLAQMLRGVIDFFNLPMSNFVPGEANQPAISFSEYDVIPAICYEIAYPHILQNMLSGADTKNNKPKIIVTVSNDAWFGDSLGPFQHMEMARMRALELGVPLVRSTNDGITAVVNAKGVQLTQLQRLTQDTLRFQISLKGYNTVYRQYGYLGLYFILGISLIFFVMARLSRSR